MISAEKKWRKIKSGRMSFSPEVSKWIKRSQVYRSLLRLHAGKIRNIGNLKRAARRCGIGQPMKMPLTKIGARQNAISSKGMDIGIGEGILGPG